MPPGKQSKKELRQRSRDLSFQQRQSEPLTGVGDFFPLLLPSVCPRQHATMIFALLFFNAYFIEQLHPMRYPSISQTLKSKTQLIPYQPPRSPYPMGFFAAPTDELRKVLAEKSKQRHDRVRATAKKTCHQIKQKGLLAYNNPPAKHVWHQPSMFLIKQLSKIFAASRVISNQLMDPLLYEVQQAFIGNRNYFVREIENLLQKGKLQGEQRDELFERMYTDVFISFKQILVLVNLHVSESISQFMKGGSSVDFSYTTALTLLREFEENKSTLKPSISVLDLGNKVDKTSHSLVRIKSEGEETYYYCDSWMQESQGGPFLSQADYDNHVILGKSNLTVVETNEVAITPDLSGYPEDIQLFFSKQRKRFIFTTFEIPLDEQQKLAKLRQQLQALTDSDPVSAPSSSSIYL